MTTTTKYYRTVLTVEILSTESVSDMELSEIADAIMEGDCSGAFTETVMEEVSEEKMAELLIAQGSDPSFLIYDSEEEE